MICITLNWGRIKEDFMSHFEVTYITNKKAHFDSVPSHLRVVDGAKLRWCNLILLDAVIYLLERKEINEGSRRSFNQQKVLIECIVAELERADIDIYHQYLKRDENFTFACDITIQLDGVAHQCQDAARWKEQIVADPTTKSRDKFVSIADSLFSHPFLIPFQSDLPAAFSQAIKQALLQYPVCHSRVAQPQPQQKRSQQGAINAITSDPATTLTPSMLDFEVSLFDDAADSELDSPCCCWNFLEDWMTTAEAASDCTHTYAPDSAFTSSSTSLITPAYQVLPPSAAAVQVDHSNPRPSHPLPFLDSAGSGLYYLEDQPPAPQFQFQSIDHNAAERSAMTTGTPTAEEDEVLHRPVATPSCGCSPFPDPRQQACSVYSRRVAFAPVVTPTAGTALPGASEAGSVSSCVLKRPRSDMSIDFSTTSATTAAAPATKRSSIVSAATSPSFPVVSSYWQSDLLKPVCDFDSHSSSSSSLLDFDIDLDSLDDLAEYQQTDLAGRCCSDNTFFTPISDRDTPSTTPTATAALPPQLLLFSRKRPAVHLLAEDTNDASTSAPVHCKARHSVEV